MVVALVADIENTQDDDAAAVAVRLGRALKQARAIANVSGAELARRLTEDRRLRGETTAIPATQIYRWEAGERPLNLRLIETSEKLMGLSVGTILRLAGYVDDGDQLNLGSLEPAAQRAIRAILREFEPPASGEDGTPADGAVDGQLQEAVRGDGHDRP